MKKCPRCNEDITGNYYYHVKISCSKIYDEKIKCSDCYKTFKNNYIYNRHKYLFHVGPITCPKCKKDLCNRSSFSFHKKSCMNNIIKKRKKIKCSKCKGKFININNHSKKCGKIKCYTCNKFYLNYHDHMKLNHPSYLKCNKCDKYYKTKKTLYCHKKDIHLSRSIYICEICGKHYSGIKNYIAHKKRHTHKIKCSKCNKEFPKVYFKRHFDSCNSRVLICSLCDTRFKLQASFKKHQTMHLNKQLLEVKNNHVLLTEKLLELKHIMNNILSL